MGNIEIPYGFNTIEGTELRTVKLRISLDRLGGGSREDLQRRGNVWMVKYYRQLKQVCLDAGLTFRDDEKFVRIEGVTASTKFYLRYKAIMSNVDAYTAKLEVEYWESLLSEAIHSSDDSDTSKFDWADYELESDLRSIDSLKANGDKFVSQTEPDENGRWTNTWKRPDGSTFESHHGPEPKPEPDSSESERDQWEFVDDGATFIRQTQPDADGRYTMTWKLRDGSIHKTHHNLYE